MLFKTIITNLRSIHKPRVNNDDVVVKITVHKKCESNQDLLVWWQFIDWHVFKLPHNQSLIIDDIKIEAEIVE